MNFIQQVYKGKNEWYLYVSAIIVLFIGWQVIGVIPLIIGAILHSSGTGEFIRAAEDSFMTLGINKNLFLFLMILTFVGGLLALWVGVKYIHRRAFKTIITSRDKIDWSRYWFGFMLWGSIALVITLLSVYLTPETSTWNFKPVPFFTLLAVSFLFLPLQTSFEELLFRGYLMQGFAVGSTSKKFPLIVTYLITSVLLYFFFDNVFEIGIFFKLIFVSVIFLLYAVMFWSETIEPFFDSKLNKKLMFFFGKNLTPLLLTSVIFGLLHGANPEVEKLGYISMVFYIGTGLLFGIVTLMDEGTELALGLHAANNIIAAILVTTDWTAFQTDALFIDTAEPSVGFEMFFPVLVLYPLMLFIFSKKYGWTNWKEKLTGKVREPLSDNYRIMDIGNE